MSYPLITALTIVDTCTDLTEVLSRFYRRWYGSHGAPAIAFNFSACSSNNGIINKLACFLD